MLQSRTTALSVAEELLQPDAPALDGERRQQLERQAWWAAMWRDPASPYEKLELTTEQRELHSTLLTNLPCECFPTANPLLLADNRDTQIVGETLALGGKMLLTSNMRTIDHISSERLGPWITADDSGSSPSLWSSRPMTSWCGGRARPRRGSGGSRRG